MASSARMHRGRRVAAARLIAVCLGAFVLLSVLAGVALAEFSLRLHRLPLTEAEAYRQHVATKYRVAVDDVAIAAADGAPLRAWFVRPEQGNGHSVIILHGITANRIGSSGFGDMFLDSGYAVLMPDSRAHGESGGALATYGVLERDDVARWTAWLRARVPGCTYLLGEWMGAAIGLQAAAATTELCAVAVEDPYSSFREIAYERLGRGTHLGAPFWRGPGRLVLESAVLYARVCYGIDLLQASPMLAVEHSGTPALLIAGTHDRNIPMHHAQELASACGARCSLWIVEGAEHGGASTVAHAEFEQRVLRWFSSHGELSAR